MSRPRSTEGQRRDAPPEASRARRAPRIRDTRPPPEGATWIGWKAFRARAERGDLALGTIAVWGDVLVWIPRGRERARLAVGLDELVAGLARDARATSGGAI